MERILNAMSACADKLNLNIYRFAAVDAEQNIYVKERIPANPCQDCYSVAKVFTATAIGMLADRGLISLEDSVADILRDECPKRMDERWRKLTVRHALTHRCGLPQGYLDIDCDDINAYGTDDFIGYIFSRQPDCAPGERYRYTDAAYYLLSRVASKAAGEEMDDFLWRELFRPLGVREAAWSKCPRGHAMGATGLYIRACDVAKLGSVYACGGVWRGKRLFSENWVREASENGCAFSRTGGDLLWGKGGMLGQMLIFSAEKHTAFAWHGFDCDPQPVIDTVARMTAE